MQKLRRLIQRHAHIAALLFAAALLLKVAVPSGYMLEAQNGHITIGVCSASGGQTMTIEIPGLADKVPADAHPVPDTMPCAFAAMAAPFLGAVDPLLLVTALAIVAALAIATAALPPPAAAPRLQPPSRGPPAQL